MSRLRRLKRSKFWLFSLRLWLKRATEVFVKLVVEGGIFQSGWLGGAEEDPGRDHKQESWPMVPHRLLPNVSISFQKANLFTMNYWTSPGAVTKDSSAQAICRRRSSMRRGRRFISDGERRRPLLPFITNSDEGKEEEKKRRKYSDSWMLIPRRHKPEPPSTTTADLYFKCIWRRKQNTAWAVLVLSIIDCANEKQGILKRSRRKLFHIFFLRMINTCLSCSPEISKPTPALFLFPFFLSWWKQNLSILSVVGRDASYFGF